MGKIRRDLNNIKYIPYDNSFTLKDYCENYNSTLNDMIYEIQFENENIQIIFLERHLPHIIGLHYYKDKNSENRLLRKGHNLFGQDGFNNMICGNITLEDLKNSRGGSVWKNKKNKKRVLSMHLIPEMIRNSSLYLVDGTLKGSIKAKYILKSNLDNTCYGLCIDEDIRLNVLGTTYCCISNLVDDNKVLTMIDENKLKKIPIIRIIKKEFYSGKIHEIVHKYHTILADNPTVTTVPVSVACVGELILNNCSFSSVYVESLGLYYITFFRIDSSVIRILAKYK